MTNLSDYVDLSQKSIWIAVGSIIFNPLFWNIVARQEYKNKVLTKLAFGKPYLGCYGLAFTIFSLGIVRDHLYQKALSEQPTLPALHYTEFKLLAAVCFAVGGILVVSSMWALGVTGTYLGDYFGILMDEKVESFPFNVTSNPMYYGSTLSFLATALWYESPAGLLLTVLVFVEYKIALLYEEPFTGEIYAKRERERAAGKGKQIEPKGSSTAVRSTRRSTGGSGSDEL
ncbi:bifunctional phosphatidyl-N-methylethanolamine N-methyltransferase/phosphatidyl-N-dimethylethanolamine N-methyltransferase [Sporobolomyces salmoneus]|uniref:bifunctional phosphatidyl-N-methylethanolamine N-methyltransferase/phosphatidyl-N-dimethylethanolamine N-methyltransferase n=1 Tax=Sporobolomyces salmoneus TaxID=183962 RepID=UPI003172A59C